jgi:nitrous oxide reductase accessory protein NosL
MNIQIVMLALAIALLTAGCAPRNQNATPATPAQAQDSRSTFPSLPLVDRTVYKNIQQTCAERWTLENMKMDTFTVSPDRDDYLVTCEGVEDGELYHCTIRVDGNGKWINDGRIKKTP